MIFLQRVNRGFSEPDGTRLKVLEDITLKIQEGQLIVIQGPSGSGKTTLLNLIAGILPPTSGKIFFRGINLSLLGLKELAVFRLKYLGYLFQHWNLLPFLTARENIEMPAKILGTPYLIRHQKVEKIALSLGIHERLDNMAEELSGGQKQRAALARALINDPILLLADEPTSSLDTQTRSEMVTILEDRKNNHNLSMLITTHDPYFTEVADKIYSLEDGTLQSQNFPK
ncbi:MAG: ABC transporter ATP-binding protein [Candidatus Heimdallarchaeota archaeon]